VAFAALLMVVLAVQTPVEQAHFDAELFQGFSASAPQAFDNANQTVAGTSADRSIPVAISVLADAHPTEAPSSAPHHHHSDGPPLHGAASGAAEPTVSTVSGARFRLMNDHGSGLDDNPQDRPPRPDLEHVA